MLPEMLKENLEKCFAKLENSHVPFRMSVTFEKSELIAIAKQTEGEKLESSLSRINDCFIKRVEKKIWDDLTERFPERDFRGDREGVTRRNFRRRLKTALKGEHICYEF